MDDNSPCVHVRTFSSVPRSCLGGGGGPPPPPVPPPTHTHLEGRTTAPVVAVLAVALPTAQGATDPASSRATSSSTSSTPNVTFLLRGGRGEGRGMVGEGRRGGGGRSAWRGARCGVPTQRSTQGHQKQRGAGCGAPEGHRRQQEPARSGVVTKVKAVAPEQVQVVPAGGVVGVRAHPLMPRHAAALRPCAKQALRSPPQPDLTHSSSVGLSSMGCGTSSGCLLSTVVRCSRSKLCFSSARHSRAPLHAGLPRELGSVQTGRAPPAPALPPRGPGLPLRERANAPEACWSTMKRSGPRRQMMKPKLNCPSTSMRAKSDLAKTRCSSCSAAAAAARRASQITGRGQGRGPAPCWAPARAPGLGRCRRKPHRHTCHCLCLLPSHPAAGARRSQRRRGKARAALGARASRLCRLTLRRCQQARAHARQVGRDSGLATCARCERCCCLGRRLCLLMPLLAACTGASPSWSPALVIRQLVHGIVVVAACRLACLLLRRLLNQRLGHRCCRLLRCCCELLVCCRLPCCWLLLICCWQLCGCCRLACCFWLLAACLLALGNGWLHLCATLLVLLQRLQARLLLLLHIHGALPLDLMLQLLVAETKAEQRALRRAAPPPALRLCCCCCHWVLGLQCKCCERQHSLPLGGAALLSCGCRCCRLGLSTVTGWGGRQVGGGQRPASHGGGRRGRCRRALRLLLLAHPAAGATLRQGAGPRNRKLRKRGWGRWRRLLGPLRCARNGIAHVIGEPAGLPQLSRGWGCGGQQQGFGEFVAALAGRRAGGVGARERVQRTRSARLPAAAPAGTRPEWRARGAGTPCACRA